MEAFLLIVQAFLQRTLFLESNSYEIVIFDNISLGDLKFNIKSNFVFTNRVAEIKEIYFTFKIILRLLRIIEDT